jgi:hypothetical protein
VMVSRMALAVVGAFSISLLAVGSGGAAGGSVVCNPHCAPSQSSNGPEVRGTDHAINMANQNGVDKGLATARQQPGNYKTPAPVQTEGGDTSGSTTGTTDTGGTTPNPCTGC